LVRDDEQNLGHFNLVTDSLRCRNEERTVGASD
jgi:hypothetical protein